MTRKKLNERREEARAKISGLKKKLVALEEAAAARIGRIAIKAGLADLDLSDDKLKEEFAAIAARFRGAAALPDRQTAPKTRARRTPRQDAGHE